LLYLSLQALSSADNWGQFSKILLRRPLKPQDFRPDGKDELENFRLKDLAAMNHLGGRTATE
jgi:hypothetical protein